MAARHRRLLIPVFFQYPLERGIFPHTISVADVRPVADGHSPIVCKFGDGDAVVLEPKIVARHTLLLRDVTKKRAAVVGSVCGPPPQVGTGEDPVVPQTNMPTGVSLSGMEDGAVAQRHVHMSKDGWCITSACPVSEKILCTPELVERTLPGFLGTFFYPSDAVFHICGRRATTVADFQRVVSEEARRVTDSHKQLLYVKMNHVTVSDEAVQQCEEDDGDDADGDDADDADADVEGDGDGYEEYVQESDGEPPWEDEDEDEDVKSKCDAEYRRQ